MSTDDGRDMMVRDKKTLPDITINFAHLLPPQQLRIGCFIKRFCFFFKWKVKKNLKELYLRDGDSDNYFNYHLCNNFSDKSLLVWQA
jgi:hypothetical protein